MSMSDQVKAVAQSARDHDRRKAYLGDGIYAELDPSGMIVLSAERDGREHIIYMEDAVLWSALKRYVKEVWNHD